MFWTFLKDIFLIILVLTVGFFAGFSIDFDENADMLDVEERLERINDEVEMYADYEMGEECDYKGRLNVFVFDRADGDWVSISFPYSYVTVLNNWGVEGDIDFRHGLSIQVHDDWWDDTDDETRNVRLDSIRNLKYGVLFTKESEFEDTTVYIWRTPHKTD